METAVEKIPAESGERVMFTKEELAHFITEINLQFAAGEGIDFGKAARNARYLAKLDRGFADIKNGVGTAMTFDALEEFVNEKRSISR